MAALLAVLTAALLLACAAAAAATQRPPGPVPPGNRITAQDGDTVLVENDARVRIVRRRDAQIRAVFNRNEGWLVLLVDYGTAAKPGDGRVDMAYRFGGLASDWPLGERWEGSGTVESYTIAGEFASPELGVVTPAGLVQFLNAPVRGMFQDAAAMQMTFGSASAAGALGQSFDAAERMVVQQARANASRDAQSPPYSVTMGAAVSGLPAMEASVAPAGDAPVRVGGSIAPPVKTQHVDAVLPAEAASAGIKGVVILEIVVDVDGRVAEARLLRSIPLLDKAAVDAVRQWRYSPSTLNGRPVPVIMTVTVNFP